MKPAQQPTEAGRQNAQQRADTTAQQHKPAQQPTAAQNAQQQEHEQLSPSRSVLLRAFLASGTTTLVLVCALLFLSCHKLWWWLFAAAESVFLAHYFLSLLPHHSATHSARRQRPDEHDAHYVKERLLQQLFRVDDIMAVMQCWFLEPGAEVKEGNVRELMAYAIWYRSL